MKKVLIIGAGEIGQAIGFLLKKTGKCGITFWDKEKGKVEDQKGLSELVPEADFIFLAIPSKAVRVAVQSFLPYVAKKGVVIALSKGIEESGKTIDELLKDFLPLEKVALLFGPMIAEELARGACGAAVIAASSEKTVKEMRVLFGKDLRIDFSDDFRGIALSGVLKNIYSIGLGIIHELSLGTNFRGWYVGAACSEMVRIVAELDGKPESVYSSAGVGDLIATGFSADSRNHQVGRELVRGNTSSSSEGSESLPRLNKLLGEKMAEYPIYSALSAIVTEGKKVSEFFPAIICDYKE